MSSGCGAIDSVAWACFLRCAGDVASAAGDVGVGEVEGFEEGRAFVAGDFGVDAAAAEAVEGALMELAIVLGFFAVGLDAGAVEGAVEAAGDGDGTE